MNREIVIPSGAGIYPLIGDVTSTPGNNRVVVTGWEGVPIAPGPYSDGTEWQYNSSSASWVPVLRAAILVNGIKVSDDYEVSVNVSKPILVNGA